MAIRRYGVLRAQVLDRRHAVIENPHYQIHAHDGEWNWRVSVNVRSQDRSDLLVAVDDDFSHPILEDLADLAPGWHQLPKKPGGAALDYIRSNLVDPAQMRAMPFFLPGPSNDLNELLDSLVSRLRADRAPNLFAFGERWGPEPHPDKIFGFLPGNGVHDVHMNQGNERRRSGSDGVYQDGALLFHFPASERWVAMFLAFQSQAWHTDDRTGHRIDGVRESAHGARRRRGAPAYDTSWQNDVEQQLPAAAAQSEPPLRLFDAGQVRIMAYVPEAEGASGPRLVLMNVSPLPVALDGWALLNEAKDRLELQGAIDGGGILSLDLPEGFRITPGRGATLSIVDDHGLRVDGVRCGRGDLARDGWATVF